MVFKENASHKKEPSKKERRSSPKDDDEEEPRGSSDKYYPEARDEVSMGVLANSKSPLKLGR